MYDSQYRQYKQEVAGEDPLRVVQTAMINRPSTIAVASSMGTKLSAAQILPPRAVKMIPTGQAHDIIAHSGGMRGGRTRPSSARPKSPGGNHVARHHRRETEQAMAATGEAAKSNAVAGVNRGAHHTSRLIPDTTMPETHNVHPDTVINTAVGHRAHVRVKRGTH